VGGQRVCACVCAGCVFDETPMRGQRQRARNVAAVAHGGRARRSCDKVVTRHDELS
jgi:hypothetical protein